jgi:hypothetical protein
VVQPRLEGRRDGEVVHRRGDEDDVGALQLFGQFDAPGEGGGLVRGVGGRVGEPGLGAGGAEVGDRLGGVWGSRSRLMDPDLG